MYPAASATARDRDSAAVGRHLPRAVKIVPSSNGHIDAGVVLGMGLAVEDDIENRKTHHDTEEDHDHDDFETFVVPIAEVDDPADITKRIADLAETQDILRVKGFAAVTGKPMRLLIQAVGPRVNHYYDRPWDAAEERQGKVVVIGLKGLDRDAVTKSLAG